MSNHQTLKIAAIQPSLYWESRKRNQEYFSAILQKLDAVRTDLIILPEMFTTGFTMNAEHCADQPEGETLTWLRKESAKIDAAITGSVIIKEEGKYYNRLYFVWPDGRYETYDKRHTFTYAGEDKVFTPGNRRLTIHYREWKICPMICYDLRFPVWSRNTEEIDVLIYVANWPASRIHAWDTLLPARAVENICYTIGVNRIGSDGNDIAYNGHSALYDPLGYQIGKLEKEGILSVQLSKNKLHAIRNRYRFLDDRDDFILT